MQFWSEIILVISNRTRTARSFNYEITRMISDQEPYGSCSDQIALHSAQLALWIKVNFKYLEKILKHTKGTTSTFYRVIYYWNLLLSQSVWTRGADQEERLKIEDQPLSTARLQLHPRPEATNYRKPFSYITSMEPGVLVDSFSGLFRVVKIALEDARTLQANLQ